MSRTPCLHCKTTARHGERISCCANCGRLFTSGTAFDKHTGIGDVTGFADGRTRGSVCTDPAELGMVRRPIRQSGTNAAGWGFPAAEGDWWGSE